MNVSTQDVITFVVILAVVAPLWGIAGAVDKLVNQAKRANELLEEWVDRGRPTWRGDD